MPTTSPSGPRRACGWGDDEPVGVKPTRRTERFSEHGGRVCHPLFLPVPGPRKLGGWLRTSASFTGITANEAQGSSLTFGPIPPPPKLNGSRSSRPTHSRKALELYSVAVLGWKNTVTLIQRMEVDRAAHKTGSRVNKITGRGKPFGVRGEAHDVDQVGARSTATWKESRGRPHSQIALATSR